jgi:hypothetical protein
MPNVSFAQLMNSTQITKVISRIKTPQSRFQSFFGMGPGGPAENPVGGHFAGWDIFDRSRAMARGRAPGTGPGTGSLNPIGHVSATLYRSHEKVYILEEKVFRTRQLGGNWGNVDARGQNYITKQEEYVAQKFKNSREYLVYSMMRGKMGLLNDGDDWVPVAPAAGTFDIDFQVPAGNLNQLDMLTTGTGIINTVWSNIGADIVTDVMQINAANEQLHGRVVNHLWTDTTVLNYLLNNTRLVTLGGTANTMFNEFKRTDFTGPDGRQDTGFEIVFKGMPWLKIHAYDGGLDVNGTYTKFFDGTTAYFCPDPDSTWCDFLVGSEIVAENVMAPGDERYGLQTWVERCTQPAGWELLVVDNGLPALYVPKAQQFATVAGF